MRRFIVPSVLYGDVRHTHSRRVARVVTLIAVMMPGFLVSTLPASAGGSQNPTLHLKAKLCADKGVQNGKGRLTVANPNDAAVTYSYVVKTSVRSYKGNLAVAAQSSAGKSFPGLPAGSFTAKVHGNDGTSTGPISAKIPTCPKVVVRHGPPDWQHYQVTLSLYDPSKVDVTFTIYATGQKPRNVTVPAGYSLGPIVPLQHHRTTTITVWSSGHRRAKWNFSPS